MTDTPDGQIHTDTKSTTPPYPPGEHQEGGFVGGTLVHTREGLCPIEQVKVGDWVLSRPGNGEGTTGYKRVLHTFRFEGKEVYEMSYYTAADPMRAHVLVATGDPPFWVKGIDQSLLERIAAQGEENPWKEKTGWNRLICIEGVELLELADGSVAFPMDPGPRPVQKTPNPEVGFVLANRKADDGCLIDFRNGKVDFRDNVWARSIDPQGLVEEYLATVYNIEVEEDHTYFVGEPGIWVHDPSAFKMQPRRLPGGDSAA